MAAEPTHVRVLRTWVNYSPTLFSRDLAVLDLLAGQGPMTEGAIRQRLPDTSGWTFRRLSTGVHANRRQSRALIERHRGMWRLVQDS
jgi:hypothetical protein